MKRFSITLFFVSILFALATSVSAKITLPKVFSDNMVLQQQTDAPIWGEASPNREIKMVTSWDKHTYITKADSKGKWKITVKTPKAGGPYNISISDGNEFKLNNVLIGEVWICSGQSNMEMPLADWGEVLNFKQEIASANYPQIRLLHVEQATSTQPLDDLKKTKGGWLICSPKTIAEFSAVGYFFGRNLYQNLNVPIGLINTSWGGTVAEAWTSGESLKLMPDFREAVSEVRSVSEEKAQNLYEQKFKEWNELILAKDNGYKDNLPVWAGVTFNDVEWNEMLLPELWEKRGLENFDGIVWFRKTIDIPSSWIGKDLDLKLGMIDDNDITFFNGEKIGETKGYNVQRNYKIPGKLVKSDNIVITVRVTDTSGGGGIYGDPINMSITESSKKDTRTVISLAGRWKYQTAVNLNEQPRAPQSAKGNPNRPTVLYNAMIHPLVPYAIQGAIWYQGESNADRASQYKELFPLMIHDWRKQWNRNFSFYFVQLANYMEQKSEPMPSNWAELREAQLQTLRLKNTGMAVSIDIGDAVDIHPKNKQDVGLRLALNARANTYGEKIAYSGPIYESYQIERNTIRIRFNHTNKGLETKGNTKLKGFAIAGSDHKFYWADAVIEGNDIIVSSPKVPFPVAVRYGWANNPDCNVYNKAGLPASPFRTDDWK